jgi:peptidase S41-like protein
VVVALYNEYIVNLRKAVLVQFNSILYRKINCRVLILLGALLFLSACVTSPSSINKEQELQLRKKNAHYSLIAPALLKIDLEQLTQRIIEVHPEPFALISKSDFIAEKEAIKKSIRYPMSRSEFYLRIAPLVVELQDIHSRVKLPKYLGQTGAVEGGKNQVPANAFGDSEKLEQSPESQRLFPLAVLYEPEHLYVAADLSAHPQVPSGAEIKSINGAPIKFILQVMRRITVRETSAGLRRKIQVDFPWLLAAMGYATNRYQIVYQWDGREIEKQVNGLRPIVKQEPSPEAGEDADDKTHSDLIVESDSSRSFYGFSQLTQKTALLWFNDFNEDPQVFAQFITQQFEQMRRQEITNLIVDVRYNDGGLSQNIKQLVSHLSDEAVFWSQTGRIKVSRPLKRLHQRKTKQRRKNKYKWGLQWLPLEWTDSLQYEISWGELGENLNVDFEPIQPSKISPPSRIVVLTNGFCFSACSSFVAIVNRYSLAETMGETAGSIARVQYAYPLEMSLPHSQLTFMLPTMKLMFDKNVTNRRAAIEGAQNLIEPKISIIRSQQQIIERQDVLLNRALIRVESSN